MNSELKGSVFRLVRPLVFAFVLVAVGGGLFSVKIPTGEDATNAERMKAVGYAFGGFLFIAAGAAILLFPLSRLVSAYFESLFWPSGQGVAPAQHKLPEWYLREGRYAEARAEYEKMVGNHPRLLEAHEGLLYVLHACMGDKAAAAKYYSRALKKIPVVHREALETYYRDLLENRAPFPSHGHKTWE